MSVPKQIEEVIKEKLKNNADIEEIKELMDLYERAKSLFVEEYKMLNMQPDLGRHGQYKINNNPYKVTRCSGVSKQLYDPYEYFSLNCSVSDKKSCCKKNVEDIVKAVSKDLNKNKVKMI